ncbi:MAG: reactive intermediate/imine deaminase [candidate division WOR-3 bacterium]|nr:MAG: reactive intermediate/imine deaminase [candidate division WOR-3 bacterium]
MKSVVKTNNAPEAIGPYSQAIKAGGFVFTAGQIAIDPGTGAITAGGIAEETKRVMMNLEAVIEAAGASMSSVVKTTVYLTKPEDFAPMNEVYAQFFPSQPPARTTVFISSLPMNVAVEIDAIARL